MREGLALSHDRRARAAIVAGAMESRVLGHHVALNFANIRFFATKALERTTGDQSEAMGQY